MAGESNDNKGKEAAITGLTIFLYYPNLIGYARFILNIIAVKYAFDPTDGSWQTFLVFYSTSMLLDGIDGNVARAYN